MPLSLILVLRGSLIQAAEALKRQGCKTVRAAISHGVLTGPAIERIEKCTSLEELVITDSIPFMNHKKHPRIKVLSVASLLGEAIIRIRREESVSSLFD